MEKNKEMSDSYGNTKRESFMSASGLSASAPPFNFKSKSQDDETSFNYNLEDFYGYVAHGCYVPFHDSFQYPSNSKSVASVAYNKLGVENTACSSENIFSQAREIGASGANTTLLLRKLCFSENLDSCGDAAVNKENYVGRLSEVDVCADAAVINGEKFSAFYPSSAIMEPHVLQNPKDTMACNEKTVIDKGKEKQNCETVINEAIDAIVMAKKDLSPGVPDDVYLESRNDESLVPVQTSSVMSDPNDSDVDSPCWKGTGLCQSAFRGRGSVSSELPKIEGESRKSLNPLAPHFFPGNAKPLVDCHWNKCEICDSSSFKKAASSVALSSKEHRLTDFVKAGTCSSEVSTAIETQFSNDTHDAGNEYSLPKKLNTSSVLHSSFGDGPCPAKEDLTFNGQGLTGANGSVEGMKPAILNGSTSVSFAPKGNLLTSFFSRDGASSHFYETFRGASKSTPPKIDVQLVINTMHDLSELLRWNCSNELDSIDEHEHDKIQRIIGNLNVCITNKVQQSVTTSESGHPCTSYCPVKLTDCHKVMKIKPETVAQDWESPANFSKKVLVSSPSRSNEGIKIRDDVTRLQIIGKSLKESQTVEEMHPRPLLNGKFWSEANAAPCL